MVKTAQGYSLVELMIVISIVILLTTLSLSGYTKAQERQTIQTAKETIMAKLQAAQKAAYIGDIQNSSKCVGSLSDVRIMFQNAGNQITTRAECTGGNDDTSAPTAIANITFKSIPDVMFRPLQQGVAFSVGSSANVDYVIGTKTYRITVTPPGTITYIGAL